MESKRIAATNTIPCTVESWPVINALPITAVVPETTKAKNYNFLIFIPEIFASSKLESTVYTFLPNIFKKIYL